MSEDERLELVRTATEAHAGLSEIAFKLRRELGAKAPGAQGGGQGRGEGLPAQARAAKARSHRSRTPPPPRGACRRPPRRQGDRYRAPAALAGSQRRVRRRTRQKCFSGVNPQVLEVHLEAENASCGLLARVFFTAPASGGGNARLGWYGWSSSLYYDPMLFTTWTFIV